MAADGHEYKIQLLASSPEEDYNPLSVINDKGWQRNFTYESSEKSDNSLSDVEENNPIPREYELYGRTPPSSRGFSKPLKEKFRGGKRKKDKQCCFTKGDMTFWKRRQSASAVSSERAFSRSVKEEESTGLFVNGHEEIGEGRPRLRSLTESSLSRRPSRRKFMSIKCKELVGSVGTTNKETKTVVCKRVKFYETLSVLVNLGQGANSEAKDKQVDEEEKYEVEELREAIWLELQAWHNNTTMLERDEYLMNARTKINGILDDVIHFRVDRSNSEVDLDHESTDSQSDLEDGCCLLHGAFWNQESGDETQDDSSSVGGFRIQSSSSEKSEDSVNQDDSPELSEFAQSMKKAIIQVTSVLNKLYSVEQLYPSRGALSKEIDKYNSKEFQESLDTMILWLNVVKGLYHKLHIMSKLVHVDLNDEKMWKDWIKLGLGLSRMKTASQCPECQAFESNCDYNVPDNFEGLKRGLSSDTTSTSRYRLFVDQNIKKMGVARLGYKVHQILHVELAKACSTLRTVSLKHVFLKRTDLHMLYHTMIATATDNSSGECDFDEKMKSYDCCETEVPHNNWVKRFQKMGLPSFDKLYIFLVQLVMDIYHECLRMRMEHRPKGEPSSLSVRQLLEESKEVLTAAVVVRQFFLDSMETIGKDVSSCSELEESISEFDEDIHNMLEVYFEYLHLLMHMLQRLPEASCGVKNILEEEWDFVKKLSSYIRGGEVQAGKRFSVMACGLLESTADFLEAGMDEYFSGLHDSGRNEKLRVKVLQSCRDFKKLFKETRERSVKALGFVKRLKNDLGVAASFHVNVSVPELLERLKAKDYVQVLTKQCISVMIFVPRSLSNSKSCVNELLNACCGLCCQTTLCTEGMDNYVVLVRHRNGVNCQWTGDQVDVNPALHTSIGLVDVQVDELAVVANSSSKLQVHRATFMSHVGQAVSCLSTSGSCHHDLIDMTVQIKESLTNLRTKICDALDGAVENFDVDKMYDIEENERARLCRSTVEALQFAFNAVFDFHREIKKIPGPEEPQASIAGKYFLELASKWMEFVVKRCERGKGKKPRWAIQGLKFLIEACHPTITCGLSEKEFEKLQRQMNICVDHVIGSEEHSINSVTPNSRGTTWGSNSKFSRSSTFPGTGHSSHSRTTRTFSEPGRSAVKRTLTLDDQPGYDEVMEYPESRLNHIRSCVAELENSRHQQLFDKGVIGRVSNKKRDLAGELAVGPKRVPFKWQRGNKIGEGQFGKVYSCVNLDTGEVVAMKQITFHPNDHSSFQDLADEIKAFEGLTHDSLVRYYGCEVHRDVMYIFMEYCGDGTISDVSKLGLPEAMIRKYADQIMVAVEFLHDRGIVHRDIKGPNIFLSSEGLIKLGDFGASVKLVNPSQTMCGEVSTLRGTIAYMAPEVITLDKGAGYGRAADIWSVGCVVVEMASGKPPWTEYDNQWAIMLKVGEGASPAIPECLSEEGKDFLSNCFVHDPHERWTARQLQNHTFLKCC